MSTLTCRRCGKSNLAFTRDRITFCKSCGVNFVVDSDNAAQAAAWLKEKVPEIPKDTLICEYCGSWFWALRDNGRPSHCLRCGKNYPIFMKTNIEYIPEMLMDKNLGRLVPTGKMIPKPGQDVTRRAVPDP